MAECARSQKINLGFLGVNNLIKTTTSIPEISQHYNKNLLSTPIPKFCDDSERLWRVYMYIKSKLEKKCNSNEIRKNRFERLEKEFIPLYERAKIKEKELEEKTGKPNKGPFYYISEPDKYHKKIFNRLRFKL